MIKTEGLSTKKPSVLYCKKTKKIIEQKKNPDLQ